MRPTIFGTVFLIVTTLFFLIGGLGYRASVVQDFGIFAGVIIAFLAWGMNRWRLVVPKYFWLYMFFVAIIGWDVMTRGVSFDSPKFFSLLFAGGFFWLAFYMVSMSRYGKEVLHNVHNYLLGLGWIYYLGFEWFKNSAIDKSDFTFGFIQALTFEHNHLGVFWAILLVSLMINKSSTKPYVWYRVMSFVLGGYLIAISQARSAYLLVLIAMVAYYKNEIFTKKLRRLVPLIMVVGLTSSIVISLNKPVRLLNFYTPAILAIKQFPFGFGIGNFREASAFYAYLYGTVDYITTLAHNLFFEMTVGVGVIGFIYWGWYALVVHQYFENVNEKRKNYFMVMFMAISVLFMVDPGYVIPTLYWLWMAFLGMGQAIMGLGVEDDLQT